MDIKYYRDSHIEDVEYFLINTNRGILDFFYCTFNFVGCRSPPSNQFLKNLKLIGGKKLVKMPVRNKSKDNPYTLGFDEHIEKYTVEFIDNKKVIRKIEISNTIYEAFNKFELDDISQMHKVQKHIEHSEVFDETLYKRAIHKPVSIEQEVENIILNMELMKAINQLSTIQKRRVKMYYFKNMTQQEIADFEHTSIRAVQYTLNSAITNLKEKLQKFKN